MIYLLFSVICSTLIFIIFKLFARFEVNNLQAIIVNYLVACSLGYSLNSYGLNPTHLLESDWFYGMLFLGFLFIGLFQLMAWASQNLGISVVSIAVKMSLVIPVSFGILFYNEGLYIIKVIGIAMALLAVYLTTKKESKLKRGGLFVSVPLILFFSSGMLDILLKYHQTHLVPSNEQGLFTASIFGVAGFLGIIMYLSQYKRKQNYPSWKNVIAGIALGIPNYGSIYFLLKALSHNGLESSVVFPINNVGIVIFSTLCGAFLFREKLSKANWLGVLLAVTAIWLITYSI
jgi:drug/metabolite transporter (DMT)-like permease